MNHLPYLFLLNNDHDEQTTAFGESWAVVIYSGIQINSMINIEQFRIGNYVNVDNVLRKICSLNNNGNQEEKLIGFEINNDVQFESAASDRLENVKITDQLLEQLGFTFHAHFKLWQHPRPKRTYSIELDYDYFPLDFSHQPIVRNMAYLHQLQNLFYSIQGEELVFSSTPADLRSA